MNQLAFPFEAALEQEAARHVMIDALPISNRLKEAIKFLDAYGRDTATLDGPSVLSTVTRGLLLEAVGVSPNSRRSWQPLRDALREGPWTAIGESRRDSHLFAVHLFPIWEETSHALTADAIAAKADELAATPPRWLALLPSRTSPAPSPPNQPPASPHRGCASTAQGVRAPPPTAAKGGVRTPVRTPEMGGARRPNLTGDGDACARASKPMDLGVLIRSPNSNTARSGPSAPSMGRPSMPRSSTTRPGKPSFWGRSVAPRELHEPRLLLQLFRDVVSKGLFRQSEQDLLKFFALAHYTRRQKCRNLVGLFTSYLDGSYLERAKDKRPWNDRLAIKDEEWARWAIRQLAAGGRPTNAEPVARERPAPPPAGEDDFEKNRAAGLAALEKRFGVKR